MTGVTRKAGFLNDMLSADAITAARRLSKGHADYVALS